jgi:hypothetical protein
MDSPPNPTQSCSPRRRLRWLAGSVVALLAAAAVAAPSVLGGGPGSISVSASLAGCERSAGSINCQIAVSFSSLRGASHYTATVTRPDGSVQELGQVGPGAATLPVTYTHNGEYVVTISAWGSGKRVASASSR